MPEESERIKGRLTPRLLVNTRRCCKWPTAGHFSSEVSREYVARLTQPLPGCTGVGGWVNHLCGWQFGLCYSLSELTPHTNRVSVWFAKVTHLRKSTWPWCIRQHLMEMSTLWLPWFERTLLSWNAVTVKVSCLCIFKSRLQCVIFSEMVSWDEQHHWNSFGLATWYWMLSCLWPM